MEPQVVFLWLAAAVDSLLTWLKRRWIVVLLERGPFAALLRTRLIRSISHVNTSEPKNEIIRKRLKIEA